MLRANDQQFFSLPAWLPKRPILGRNRNFIGSLCLLSTISLKGPINKFKLVQQSRQQVLKAYCPKIYILCFRLFCNRNFMHFSSGFFFGLCSLQTTFSVQKYVESYYMKSHKMGNKYLLEIELWSCPFNWFFRAKK